ncbi:MAG: ABC transporter ATP-binding protein [Acidobacteria bacterium]|nr:ABC transporter ATP-binding protein [Acidobacteriota bacterium]
MVEVRDLVKHYGPIRAVDGISFEVHRGDVLGFLGPNGAGKTTAMKMITGFLEPDHGTVKVAGFDVATEGLESRRRVGYLPENAPAYGEMTVEGFLDFIAEVRGIADRPRAVAAAIRETGLEGVVHQIVDTLSKGYKRRVGLAQALIHDPEVLILDEPTDGLDPNQKAVVHELIARLASNKAIILSTHILDEVEAICNRTLIISEGKILEDSTPAELMRRAPRHNVIRLRLAAYLAEDGVESLRQRLLEQEWCGAVDAPAESVLEVRPRDGGNYLRQTMDLVRGSEVEGIELLEGRLNDLFREVTKGVAA